MIQIPLKQGDTFVLEGVVKINDVVQDISDWSVNSKVVLSAANFTDTLVVTKVDAVNGKYQLKKQDTTAWPSSASGKAILCDVEYVLPSTQILSTETFSILCVSGIT